MQLYTSVNLLHFCFDVLQIGIGSFGKFFDNNFLSMQLYICETLTL
jgi:hypothetical protein